MNIGKYGIGPFLVIVATCALGLACQDGVSTTNKASNAQTTNAAKANTASLTPAAPAAAAPADDAPRIELKDAKAAYDSGAIFVDTRADGAYKMEHIKGAINVTQGDIDAKISMLPKGKKIIAYCSWPNEHTSASLVSELKKRGYDNVFAMLGGTQAWHDAGYPMEKG